MRVPARRAERHAKASHKMFPAPTLGWAVDDPLAAPTPGTARVMENWFPTKRGVRLRKGAHRIATLPAAVQSLFPYETSETSKLFGATAWAIYNVTEPDSPTEPFAPVISGMASGRYSWAQIGTVGGEFLYAVNGADYPLLHDGEFWHMIGGDTITRIRAVHDPLIFTVGETVTSGAVSATIVHVSPITATLSAIYVDDVTGGSITAGMVFTAAVGTFQATNPIRDSPVTITGADVKTLSQVWLYASRLFFVQRDSLNAWYLPVDSIGGALGQVSLAAVFQRGGTLLFGASWSIDAGDGMDDRCVFVSEAGEVAVYAGTNPASASTWRLQGRYDIPRPLGNRAWLKVGGDLLILTEEGIVPMSAVVTKDPAALSLAAVTRRIESEWASEVASRPERRWEMVKWDAGNMGLVTLPSDAGGLAEPACLAVNLETGAWAKFTGWAARCFAVRDGAAYFGDPTGRVMQVERGGDDDGEIYVCRLSLAPDHLGRPGGFKTATLGRALFLTGQTITPQISASGDYCLKWPVAPPLSEFLGGGVWDASDWDAAAWDGLEGRVSTLRWQAIGESGVMIAPQVQVTVGSDVEPLAELLSVDLMFERGAVVT